MMRRGVRLASSLAFLLLLLAVIPMPARGQSTPQTYSNPTVSGYPVGTAHPAPGTSSPQHTALRFCKDRGHPDWRSYGVSVREAGYSYIQGSGGVGDWRTTGSSSVTILDTITCAASGETPDPLFQQTLIDQGPSWQLINIQGEARDDNAGAYNANVFVLQNAAGIQNAPLSPNLRADLDDDVGATDTVIFVDQKIANEILLSEQQGSLTPYLQSIAEPGESLGTSPHQKGLFGKCSNKAVSKSKSFNINTPLSQSGSLGGGFEGSLSMSGGLQASATGEIHVELKRFGIFGICIPYGVKFNNARAFGNLSVSPAFNISGTIKYTYNWEKELVKIKLFSLNFMIGPVPVHIGFNMPLTLGLELQASVTGTVNYNASQPATGSFDYTCTLDSCAGGASFNTQGTPSQQPVTAGLTGRVQPSLWVEAGIRAYLYDEWIAYAQIGLRPYLRADFWGYYGNACGDGDGDGISETVDALTLDLDWQLYVTGRASLLGGSPKKWNDIWHTNRKHIKFWDLIGSFAAHPMLVGPATAQATVLQSYGARMRPCWPYGDTVDYQIDWGDGGTTSLSGAPQTQQGTSHAWASEGLKTVDIAALRDSHGRTFDFLSSARNITVSAAPGPGGGAQSFDFSASNTAYASQNTVNRSVTLTAGQTLTVGTCGMTGAYGTGDTFLRLAGPSGATVSVNDDACTGGLSKLTYTVPSGANGSYTIMAGCFAATSCSGRVVWTVN